MKAVVVRPPFDLAGVEIADLPPPPPPGPGQLLLRFLAGSLDFGDLLVPYLRRGSGSGR